jgi:hypothetical protein
MMFGMPTLKRLNAMKDETMYQVFGCAPSERAQYR